MSDLRFTPGPWHLIPGDWLCPRIGAPGFKRAIADAIQRDPHPVDGDGIATETALANARLIASAPDLLAVVMELQESASYWSEYEVPLGIVDRINAAIARATGGEA